jgi:cation transport ATPase
MGFAGLGYISPGYGALFQEILDVTVILNALRAR